LAKINKFIAFSGIDSAGKSTQIMNIVKYFIGHGEKTKIIWSRGGYTPIINTLKSIIRKITPNSIPEPGKSKYRDKTFNRKWVRILWLNVALIDLIVFYCLYFRWLKYLGYIVIADRYLWDTYIDFELKFKKDSFENTLLWKTLVFLSPSPDSSIILIIPIEESIRRSKLKKEPFSEDFKQRKKRLELYHDLIKKGRWDNVIDGSGPINEVWYNIKNKLE
jgi:thymidylate kinase